MLPVSNEEAPQSAPREQANRLVAAMAARSNAGAVTLDDKDRAAFGGAGYRFDPKTNLLIVSAFVAKAYLPSSPEPMRENFRKVARALNDPKIGGLYEHGGGVFVLDETERKYFLVREFPVSKIAPRQFCEEVNDQLNLSATWSLRWFGRVARITHGKEPPPAAPVTRQHPE